MRVSQRVGGAREHGPPWETFLHKRDRVHVVSFRSKKSDFGISSGGGKQE